MRFNSTNARSLIAVVTGVASSLATSAHAALPAGFAGAITQYQADTVEAIGLLMAAGVVIWGVLKLKSKLGL